MIGLHRNQGGDASTINPAGEYVTRMVAAGHTPFVVVIGEGGHAAQLSDAGALVAFAKDDWRGRPAYDSGDPAGDAAQRWATIRGMVPPEIAARRDSIWLIILNEPDKERARYVFAFMLEVARLANADGYRVCGPNWSTGTPEVDEWETPEGLAWLRYCAENPDKARVALHEYSLDPTSLATLAPWLIGRYQFILDVCDDNGIQHPRFLICECGWTYNDMPAPDVAVTQMQFLIDTYGDIPVALWTMGAWSSAPNLPKKLAAFVPTLTDWLIANVAPPDEPPPPDPGLWYKSIVVLAPQDYTLEQMLELRSLNYANRRTITQSHDEALQLRALGAEGSYTIVYDIERWEADIQRQLVAGLHQLRTLAMAEFAFAAWPTDYLTVTQIFGARPEYYSQFGLPGHEGVDIRAPHGSPIYAVAGGTVYLVTGNQGNYGVQVRIDHGNGYKTVYAHNAEILVREGDVVTAGQQIARADNTGNSSASHLHLTLKRDGHAAPGYPNDIIDPTPLILPFNPTWPGDPPPPPTLDVLPYLMGDGRLYEVRNAAGGQERFQTQRATANVFFQTKNAAWEMLVYDSNYIYRDIDTSPGGGRYYRLLENGAPRSRWIPRHWRPGEDYTRARRVQFYWKDSCAPSAENSGDVTDTMRFVALHATYTFRTGITLPDVIELLWVNGGERYWYARNFGLVAWERQHQDPHTPQWSAISELHGPGDRPPNAREHISCLGV